MKITIFKFRVLDPNITSNYFAANLGPLDKIIFEKQLINGFPIFREELSQEDDVEIFKTGYFDLRFSLIASERSANGDDIYNFFLKVEDSYATPLRYLVICETGNPERIYSGFIDIESIQAALNPHLDEYSMQFSVTGIEKEAVEYMQSISLQRYPYLNDPLFESNYLPQWHFKDLGGLLRFESRLNMESKVGFPVMFYSGEQRRLFDYGFVGGNYTIYDGLKSYMLGLGLRFKVVFDNLNFLYPIFKLVLFFRSQGLNSLNHSISNYLSHKKKYALTKFKAVFIPFGKSQTNHNGVDFYTGMILLNETVYVADFSLNNWIEFSNLLNGFQFRNGFQVVSVPNSDVHWVNLASYNGNITYLNDPWHFAYCRCLYKQGEYGKKLDVIIKKTAGIEYLYVIKQLKARKLLTVKVPDESNLVLNSKTNLEGKDYVCERINSFDNFNKTMETEWIES